jgi:hypothetical protein
VRRSSVLISTVTLMTLAMSIITGFGASASEVALSSAMGDPSVPIGFTADLDGVRDLMSVRVSTPYQFAWQRELSAFQERFEVSLPSADIESIDPVVTGSITSQH